MEDNFTQVKSFKKNLCLSFRRKVILVSMETRQTHLQVVSACSALHRNSRGLYSFVCGHQELRGFTKTVTHLVHKAKGQTELEGFLDKTIYALVLLKDSACNFKKFPVFNDPPVSEVVK